MRPASNTQSGMTLLEVMVALAIFALAGTAAMKAASDHLNSVSRIEENTFATWVANNRLNEMKLTGSWPPKNNIRGSAEMAERTWYWQQNVKKTADADLLAVEVSVGLDEQYEYFNTSVVTYVAKPADIAASNTVNGQNSDINNSQGNSGNNNSGGRP